MPLRLVLAVCLFVVTVHAAPKPKFEVKFSDLTTELRLCSVVFSGEKPAPAVVDKIVRSALESALLLDANSDILATAYHEGDVLSTKDYAGPLRYRARDKKILTADSEPEPQRSSYDVGPYFVEVTEERSSPELKPEKRWLSASIIFADVPQRTMAYAAVVTEVRKLASRGQELIVYVMQGNKYSRTTWHQIKDTDGGYLHARFDPATGEVGRYNAATRTMEYFDKLPVTAPRVAAADARPAGEANNNAPAAANSAPTPTGGPAVKNAPSQPAPDPKQTQDAKRLLEWQIKRAAEGSATAQYDLALKYYRGEGVEKNEAEARRLFKLAADQAHPGAMRMLDLLKE
ncbi:MAG: hypothetical protein AB1705_10460 [Verrucomicrobiota bacterium]